MQSSAFGWAKICLQFRRQVVSLKRIWALLASQFRFQKCWKYLVWKLKIHCKTSADNWDWPEAEGTIVRRGFLSFPKQKAFSSWCHSFSQLLFNPWIHHTGWQQQPLFCQGDNADLFHLRTPYSCATLWAETSQGNKRIPSRKRIYCPNCRAPSSTLGLYQPQMASQSYLKRKKLKPQAAFVLR